MQLTARVCIAILLPSGPAVITKKDHRIVWPYRLKSIIGKNFDKTSTFNARNKDAQNNNIKLSLMTVT